MIERAAALFLAAAGTLAAQAHFHHLHLNTTDPKAAADFYAARFDCEKSRFGGEDAIWAQRSWLLFQRVTNPPAAELTSAIWHFGWGAENMKAEVQRQTGLGTRFFTPLTDISWLAPNVAGGFYYAYVDGPGHALIELNTASHHRFGHLHLLSEDPVGAAEWYVKYLGAQVRGQQREARFHEGIQLAPSASLMMDNVNIIIYPIQYSRKAYPSHWKSADQPISPTRGRVVDHVAFSVERLEPVLRTPGIRIEKPPTRMESTGMRHAFIEGPDRVSIELIEQAGADWGANHAGQTPPEFVHGDECLFCHRQDIGTNWPKNVHGAAVRQLEDKPDEYILGRTITRRLKKDGYGKFAIAEGQNWDGNKFANRCTGCHSTAVDSKTRTFAAFGIDCYSCHGDATLDHTKDTSLMWLSKKRRSDVKAVTSICAQCHLRGGHSLSTGLPYANNFIAGDNLFLDCEADLSRASDTSLSPGDRHIWRNVRSVLLEGSETTCLSCHGVHGNSTAKHRLVLSGAICLACHNERGPKKAVKRYEVHSRLCEY